MPYKRLAAERLYLTRIDADAIAELQAIRDVVEPAFDEMLDKLYVRVLDAIEYEVISADLPRIDRLRIDLKTHWHAALFSGVHDESYREQTFKIGQSHARLGLTPDWYLECYGQILCQLIELIFRHCEQRGESAVSRIQTLSKIFYLDMDLILNSYLDAKDQSMRSILLRSTELREDMWKFSDQINATVTEISTVAETLANDTLNKSSGGSGQKNSNLKSVQKRTRTLLEHARQLERQAASLDKHLRKLPMNEKLYLTDGGLLARMKNLFFEKQYQGTHKPGV